MYRYVVTEYTFKDNDWMGEKRIIGSYDSMKKARVATGEYVKSNVHRMKKKYRHWRVDVHKEVVYFPIKGTEIV